MLLIRPSNCPAPSISTRSCGTKRSIKIEDIKHETRHAIPVDMDQEEAAAIMQQYDLRPLPWLTKTSVWLVF